MAEDDVGGQFDGITLEIVVPDSTNSFSYVVLPLGPNEFAPDDLYIDTSIDGYNMRLNGTTIGANNGFDETIFAVDW